MAAVPPVPPVSPDSVKAYAAKNIFHQMKLSMLEKCVDAFRQNHPENLQAFFAGYVAYRRGRKTAPIKLDKGYQSLVVTPALNLIEASAQPADTAKSIVAQMTPENSQSVLDLLLCKAAENTKLKCVAALLEAGANPNANGGEAIRHARVNYNYESMRLLHRYGGDFEEATRYYVVSLNRLDMIELHEKFKLEETVAQFQQQLTDLTKQVKSLQEQAASRAAPAAPQPAQPGT